MITELTQLSGVLTAEVIDVDVDGKPVVAWAGVTPTSAQAIWMPGAPTWHDCVGLRVLIAFLNGDETQPVVLGLLDAPSAPTATASPSSVEETPRILRVEAGQELVIECGEAKISLRKDGRIEIRGTHLISRSSGPNKIKGGSVFIN